MVLLGNTQHCICDSAKVCSYNRTHPPIALRCKNYIEDVFAVPGIRPMSTLKLSTSS